METVLSLVYRGPAVDDGQMDVYQASANMIAFSEFVVAAAKAAYGDAADARARVSGFGRGSFITDLVFQVAGPAATIFTAVLPSHEHLAIVKQAIELWKMLRGQPPKEVKHLEDAQHVEVTTNSGQLVVVKTNTLNLVFNDKAAESVQQFIKGALSREGMDSVLIQGPGGPAEQLAEVKQSEAAFFGPVKPSQTITDAKIRMHLIIEAPVFKEGNKWRFSDGQASFYADIQDKEFLARVDNGERFGKGDILEVDLQLIQDQSGTKITTERVIVSVIGHRAGQEQKPLI